MTCRNLSCSQYKSLVFGHNLVSFIGLFLCRVPNKVFSPFRGGSVLSAINAKLTVVIIAERTGQDRLHDTILHLPKTATPEIYFGCSKERLKKLNKIEGSGGLLVTSYFYMPKMDEQETLLSTVPYLLHHDNANK